MSLISDEELSALVSLERLYGVVTGLVEQYGIEEEATSIKIGGRYYSGSMTINSILDSTDEVLERAKQRKIRL